MSPLIEMVHVSIPFRMLCHSYLSKFIELGIRPEIGLDMQTLEEHSLADFDRVSGRLRARGLSVTLHFPFMDLSAGSPDPGVRDLTRRRFEEMLPLVAVFKPLAVVCHAGYDSRRYWFLRELWHQQSVLMWGWLGERIRKEGGALILENVYEDGPEDLQGLLGALGDAGVGFCLDTGHQSAFSRSSLREWVRVLAPHIRQIHLHDNRREHDDHMALGEGIIDFAGFFQDLRAVLESPPLITLEPHREEDLLPSLRFLEGVWPW